MKEDELNLEEQIGQQQEKSKATFGKIEGVIDRMLQLYEQAQQRIMKGDVKKTILEELNKQLLHMRPLKTVREHYMHYYRKLSNLIKKVQANPSRSSLANSKYSRRMRSDVNSAGKNQQAKNTKRFNAFFGTFMSSAEEKSALNKLIVQHFLREGKMECVSVWSDIEKEIQHEELFKECIYLKNCILEGRMEQAIKWAEGQKLFQTHEILLEYELRKLHIIMLIEKNQSQAALKYIEKNMVKFHKKCLKELQLLISHILFKSSQCWLSLLDESSNSDFKNSIENRYQIFQFTPKRCTLLAEQFSIQYLQHNVLGKFNALKIIHGCSKKVQNEYLKLMTLMWQSDAQNKQKRENEKEYLPFSIELEKEYQYHSLFLCPITKEVHSNNEPSILLACGHMISQNANTRIIHENRNKKKIKCPICQKDIRVEDSMKVEF